MIRLLNMLLITTILYSNIPCCDNDNHIVGIVFDFKQPHQKVPLHRLHICKQLLEVVLTQVCHQDSRGQCQREFHIPLIDHDCPVDSLYIGPDPLKEATELAAMVYGLYVEGQLPFVAAAALPFVS